MAHPDRRLPLVLLGALVLLVAVGRGHADAHPSPAGWGIEEPSHRGGLMPDTIIRDTIRPVVIPPIGTPPDSVLEGLAPESDTLLADEFEEFRQVLPRNVPDARGGVPARPEAGVWEFDREALLATHALTVHDLISHVPGMVLLRGGDIGNPVVATTFGLGPGEIRVFRDGVEDPPMEGGVLDLGQVALAGLESVRVERRPGEVRIHLRSLRIADPRPYTYLDVATGDLRTNIFRATFAHPDAFGGTLLFALDRADTDGPGRNEPSAIYGTHIRYSLFRGPDRGLALSYRGRTSQRPEGFLTPLEVNRRDLGFRGGWEISETLTVEGFGNRTTVQPGSGAEAGADTLLPAGARSHLGARLSGEWDALWARGEARIQSGDGWPTSVLGLEVGGTLEGLGGGSVGIERERWEDGEAGRSLAARAWTEPRFGLSFFADYQEAERGVPFFIPPEHVEEENGEENGNGNGNGDGFGGGMSTGFPDHEDDDEVLPDELLRFGERSGVRAGVRAEWRGVDLTAAALRVEADSLRPMGLPFDRDGVTFEGGSRSGMEISGRVPLRPVLDGLQVSGHLQVWETAPAWRYMPDRTWMGALNWHHLGYDSNLEVWFDVGARGRDAMVSPVAGSEGDFDLAPSALSWFGRLQFRVLTVRVFVHWENFTLRDDIREFPERRMPQTRAVYGIRWTMWN